MIERIHLMSMRRKSRFLKSLLPNIIFLQFLIILFILNVWIYSNAMHNFVVILKYHWIDIERNAFSTATNQKSKQIIVVLVHGTHIHPQIHSHQRALHDELIHICEANSIRLRFERNIFIVPQLLVKQYTQQLSYTYKRHQKQTNRRGIQSR